MEGSLNVGEPWCKRRKKVIDLQSLLTFFEQQKDGEALRLVSGLDHAEVKSLIDACQNWGMPLEQLAKEAHCINTLCKIWEVNYPDQTQAHFLVQLNRPDLLGTWLEDHQGAVLDRFLATPHRLGNQRGETAAHFAACEGKVRCLEVFANKFSEILYVLNNFGESPAMWAAWSGHSDCLEVLQKTFNLRDCNGRTVAHAAALAGHFHVLEKLHSLGFTELLETADLTGRVPAHWAASSKREEGRTKCLRALARLLGARALQACDTHGCTPAHLAAKHGFADCFTVYADPEFVSISGTSLFGVDHQGRSPAHWAAAEGNLNCLRKLHELYHSCMAVHVRSVMEVLKCATAHLQTDLQYHEHLATRDGAGDTPAHLTYCIECFKYLKSIGGTCVFSGDVCEKPQILHETYQFWLNSPSLLDMRAKASWISWCITSYGSQEDLKLEVSRANPLQLNLCNSFGIQPSGNIIDGTEAKNVQVYFAGERAAGDGLRREWVSSVVGVIMDPNQERALFRIRGKDGNPYPNPNSGFVDSDHLSYFALLGMLCGLSLRNKEPLGADVRVSNAFVKVALGMDVDVDDLKSVDPECFEKKIKWIRNAAKHELDELNWTFEDDGNEEPYMATTSTLLKENGNKIFVTIENREEYCKLLARHRLVDSIKDQISAFRKGLEVYTYWVDYVLEDSGSYDISCTGICGAEGFSQLVFGKSTPIDVEEWKKETIYEPNEFERTQVVDWFWSLVSQWDEEARVKLLSFVTGSKRVPAGGFATLMGLDGRPQRFNLERVALTPGLLPTARVCLNTLRLPEYHSSSSLKASLERAISEQQGFDERAVTQP